MNRAFENIYRLRVFLEVADCLSFSGAAERLFLTQPAVSRHISALEEALGLALFTHRTRRLQLTEAGTTVAGQARMIVAAVSAAEIAVDSQLISGGNYLSVGSSAGWAELLYEPIGEFLAENPGIKIKASFRPNQEVHNALLSRRISLGFFTTNPLDARLETMTIGDCEVVLIAPPGHPLSVGKPIEPRALEGIDFVAFGFEPRQHFGDFYLRQLGIRPHYVAELSSTNAVKGAVEAGAGLSMVLASAVLEELIQGKLVSVPLIGPPLRQDLFVSRQRDSALPPIYDRFLSSVRSKLHKFDRNWQTARGQRARVRSAN